jgi:thiol-disulfide isomerase/thioredoxin
MIETELKHNTGYLMVIFLSDNCHHCVDIENVIKMIAEVVANVRIVKIDTNVSREIALKYSVELLPTVDIYKKDVLIDRVVGKQQLTRYIKRLT